MTVRRLVGTAVIILSAALSCGPRYAPDPADGYGGYGEYTDYGDTIDVTARVEVREVRGEFWCNGYGDYFLEDETGEIWCTFGGGLCPMYEALLDELWESHGGDIEGVWVEAVLSGSLGYYIDELHELDCSRPFYVTIVHEMRAYRPWYR